MVLATRRRATEPKQFDGIGQIRIAERREFEIDTREIGIAQDSSIQIGGFEHGAHKAHDWFFISAPRLAPVSTAPTRLAPVRSAAANIFAAQMQRAKLDGADLSGARIAADLTGASLMFRSPARSINGKR